MEKPQQEQIEEVSLLVKKGIDKLVDDFPGHNLRFLKIDKSQLRDGDIKFEMDGHKTDLLRAISNIHKNQDKLDESLNKFNRVSIRNSWDVQALSFDVNKKRWRWVGHSEAEPDYIPPNRDGFAI